MEQEIGSSLDILPVAVHEMSEEDRQAVASLYQRSPTLWSEFGNIADCVDVLGNPTVSTEEVCSKLRTLWKAITEHWLKGDGKEVDLCQFAVATGLVGRAVEYYRRTLRELGKSYMSHFCPPFSTQKEGFLCLIRQLFLGCPAISVGFSRRLIETGFVKDLVEDLRHAQHMTGHTLEQNSVVLFSMGPLQNFCLHAETEVLVKEMGLVPVITPFLNKNSEVVKAISLATISHLVTDDQLDLLRMGPGVVTHFLQHIKEAIFKKDRLAGDWTVEEILSILLLLCRCEFNKKILVAMGATKTLLSLLDPTTERKDDEKQYAIKILLELSTNSDNLWVFQKSRHLFSAMNSVMATGCPKTKDLAIALVTRVQHVRREDPRELLQGSSALAEMLSDQLNMLAILDVSPVHFVLDHLTTPQPQGAGSRDSKVRVLRALAELAQRSEHCRRELMAADVLTLTKDIFQHGNNEESALVLEVVLALFDSEENLAIFKSQAEVLDLLKAAAAQCADSLDHRDTATRLLSYLDQQ